MSLPPKMAELRAGSITSAHIGPKTDTACGTCPQTRMVDALPKKKAPKIAFKASRRFHNRKCNLLGYTFMRCASHREGEE